MSAKVSITTNKSNSIRHTLGIPFIIIFLIGFFFLSSLKIKIVYSTAAPTAATAIGKNKPDI
jgi:hypothetical protein